MSRLCVKNLPKYVKEDRLREFFSQKGEVTDTKLMRTKDGKSRQFAFVGFRTERDAEEALNYFNNSYLDTCRITCEVARKVGDPSMPRPWSRYSKVKEEHLKETIKGGQGAGAQILPANRSKSSNATTAENSENDPQFDEFLKIMQPRAKSKLWANDTFGADEKESLAKASKKKQSSQVQVGAGDGSEEEDKTTQDDVEEDKTTQDDVSDMDYFRSRVKSNWSEDSDVENNDNEEPTSVGDESKQALDSSRLFVRNLSYTTNEDELIELFSQFGDVLQVHLVLDKDTKQSKGIAYVMYTLPESACRALQELDNSIFQGRLLHVMPAKSQPSAEKLESILAAVQDKTKFKQRREEQRKASEASGDTRAWNSLFMRQDTVVEYIVRKHGISKSELLDREANNDLAVLIALGETHVIAETKKALSSAGVNVAALEEHASGKTKNMKRSNHVILVKNLPYGSSEGDLANMFGKFGSLDKVILPPTKVSALVSLLKQEASFVQVIFLEATEARVAFKSLAYRRYKDSPLYLEWAPGNILSPDATSDRVEQKNIVSEKNIKSILLERGVEGIHEEDIDPDRVESRSVFVKNLNFKTSDESLHEHFSNYTKKGSIKSVKVKKHLKNGKNVSMGFGFIEFDSVETAADVCKDLQGTILDGHALILQLCHAKKDGKVLKKDGKGKSSTKLIVKNVAFEATTKDLRQLFSPFGEVKSLRLPKKHNSSRHDSYRGFAFVEYVTKQEAQNALQSLSSTHLYGRRLLIEPAKEEESLADLRARTAAQFVDEQSGFQKPSKRRKHMGTLDEGTAKFARIN